MQTNCCVFTVPNFEFVVLICFRADFVAEGHIPFTIVENESFIKFVRLLQPSYTVPSRQSLRSIVIGEASVVMEKVCFNVLNLH